MAFRSDLEDQLARKSPLYRTYKEDIEREDVPVITNEGLAPSPSPQQASPPPSYPGLEVSGDTIRSVPVTPALAPEASTETAPVVEEPPVQEDPRKDLSAFDRWLLSDAGAAWLEQRERAIQVQNLSDMGGLSRAGMRGIHMMGQAAYGLGAMASQLAGSEEAEKWFSEGYRTRLGDRVFPRAGGDGYLGHRKACRAGTQHSFRIPRGIGCGFRRR